ncbi:MAG TPA: ACT domain-containing protein [Thermoanaerobaculia bacterium]|nr:ACT domain-containing protein [Thermoanaerobaculia bacterium]
MQLHITIVPHTLAVSRLHAGDAFPDWARGAFVSITRTSEELSVVCDEGHVPESVTAERGWTLLKVEGPIPFETTGVASALVAPLAKAKISVFPIATYDTDYLLVKADALVAAIDALRSAGHVVNDHVVNGSAGA